MRALIIDDSRALRRILSDMLRQLGFTVTEAADGREGLAALAGQPLVDVALVDWNMPVMNGLEFVCAVRANASYHSLPVMMVTTETEMEQMAVALEAGANEYLMKPFSKDSLADKLAMLGVLRQELV